jgi:large conductance mechanosensitive channel
MTEAKPVEKPTNKSLMQQFIDFLQTFGVIGLAIAFIIGVAASGMVTALVNDIINPFIGIFLPSGNLQSLNANVTSINGKTVSTFAYGDLISKIINFLIIAFIVFLAYKQLSRSGLLEDKTVKK